MRAYVQDMPQIRATDVFKHCALQWDRKYGCGCSAVLNLANMSTAFKPQLIFDILPARIISAIHRRGAPGNARLSAHGDLELRFCMFQRLRSYGITFMHV